MPYDHTSPQVTGPGLFWHPTRETRVAARLRAIQHAYQAVAGHDTAFTPPEPGRTFRPRGYAADKEIELK
jgi:hypothetical protein